MLGDMTTQLIGAKGTLAEQAAWHSQDGTFCVERDKQRNELDENQNEQEQR